MRLSRARSSGPAASFHMRSWVDCITTTSVSEFSVHTGLALRSHLVLPRFTTSPPERPILRSPRILRGWCPSLFLADEKIAEPGGISLRRVPAHGKRAMPRVGVCLAHFERIMPQIVAVQLD